MKTVLKIASILSWFNGILWGFFVLLVLLLAIFTQSFAMVIAAFLLSVIVLHSYAAIQLQRSVRNPSVKLSNQTPVGVRFVGFVALFFGIVWLGDGVTVLLNPMDSLKSVQSQMPQLKDVTLSNIRGIGISALVLGLCIAVNVLLNFRLLRWYYLVRQSDIS